MVTVYSNHLFAIYKTGISSYSTILVLFLLETLGEIFWLVRTEATTKGCSTKIDILHLLSIDYNSRCEKFHFVVSLQGGGLQCC